MGRLFKLFYPYLLEKGFKHNSQAIYKYICCLYGSGIEWWMDGWMNEGVKERVDKYIKTYSQVLFYNKNKADQEH